MNKPPDNFLGAALFWLYMVTALSLTALIIKDLVAAASATSHPKATPQTPFRHRKVQVFAALSTLSFAVVSLHMLFFLIDSYRAWALVQLIPLPSSLLELLTKKSVSSVWTWSYQSMLFRDFAHDLCADPRHYWWTAQHLVYSFGWNLFMTGKAKRHAIPHLWAYLLLGQVLPIAFAQNLFCAALFLHTPPPKDMQTIKYPSRARQTLIVAIFCAAIALAPMAVHTQFEIPSLFAARALLLAPAFMAQARPASQTKDYKGTSSLRTCIGALLAGFAVFLAFQSRAAGSITSAVQSIHDSHAVAALGYGYLLGLGSLLPLVGGEF